jgi:hypothetical protein
MKKIQYIRINIESYLLYLNEILHAIRETFVQIVLMFVLYLLISLQIINDNKNNNDSYIRTGFSSKRLQTFCCDVVVVVVLLLLLSLFSFCQRYYPLEINANNLNNFIIMIITTKTSNHLSQ